MPIDLAKVVGAELPRTSASWTADDVILYHLGLGAGATAATDPRELAYVYEAVLKVLPSFGVVPAFGALTAMLELDGMDVDLALLLHGEQELEVHEPIPPHARVHTSARVTGVHDKGKAALVVLEAVTADAADGRPLVTNRFGAFVRGEGGFGGDGGPPPPDLRAPDRAPDHVVACPTLPQQALLYRLSGDRNPIHADPAFARRGGFDRPILHGLCTYGIALKAVVDAVLDGDVARVAGFRARFAGVVLPGETIEVSLWEDPAASRVLLSARCRERDTPVLSHAAVALR